MLRPAPLPPRKSSRNRLVPLAAALAALVFASCLAWRGVLEPIALEMPDDPESGPAVVIGRVSDARSFVRSTEDPRQPSLYYRVSGEVEVTRRIVGRRLGARGGNLFLPEGQRVEDLTRDAVTRAFRLSGYRVLEASEADTRATRVDVTILNFWSWYRNVRLGPPTFRSEIVLLVDAPMDAFGGGRLSCGQSTVVRGAANAGVWRRTLTRALEDLVGRLSLRLREPPESIPSWFCAAPQGSSAQSG